MPVPKPSFTIGIEEEYLIVDRETRALVSDPPAGMLEECGRRLEGRVSPEFLRAQIEIGTHPHSEIQHLAADLADTRRAVCEVAEGYGAAIIASSTHPFALWWEQMPTPKERYQALAQDLGAVAHRLVICGMHVHVGIEDPDLRIDLMDQVTYFLPHLLALTTSSPFWGGRNTGLKSYRMSVFRALPRTGLPEHFTSWGEYVRHIGVLVDAGIIEDGTKVWWDVRPSARYPTLEMRIADVCTRLADAVSVASLFVSILHMLYRRRLENQRWRTYANFLINENIWRAQRYGCRGSLMDYGKGELVPFPDLMAELVELVSEDAAELGCLDEVRRIGEIVQTGTSAERQVQLYERLIADGSDPDDALRAVVDLLVEDTLTGL